jgi:hypothetical protein
MKKPKDLAQELIDLRTKHGKVREFIVPLDEDDETKTATFFLRPCDTKTENMIHKQAKGSRERAVIMGLKALQLGGDPIEDIQNNEYAIRAAEAGLLEYMEPGKVIIKKN